ncbi:MAG TPA: serine/threonine-protein kinase [Rhodanobacteraceae bacterium]|nr:serine/threonine-protein kinase [Rhodanobacteraceae bacterium]
MNQTARWPRIKQLFHDSQQISGGERDAWLVVQCGDDVDLLREVRGLLSAQQASHDILDAGATGVLKHLRSDEPGADLSGSQFGSYRLLRLIGEGGMGSVYLAERDDGDFVQRVALKVVRADFAGSDARARFLRERNFLARLIHPHIAQLHDGGLGVDGTPYFTLEYVEGEPITRYCDERKLGVRQRIGLVLQICSAIAYAHRNLIVHRDLKPSNILVNAEGDVKLLDFGIAKLVDPDVAEGQTGTQARLMTPEYAAPEQVLGEPITTATDVYAIGVLLYEVLTGRLPYALADAGTISWAKAVVEESPEAIHRALGRTTQHGTTPTGEAVAAARGTTLSALRRDLRGDLDRIIQRALAKQPDARYASVAALADDLRAYSEGRAISGGSRRYRMRVFARRHWLPLTVTAVFALTLVGSAAAIVWQSRQVAHEAQNTLQVKNFLFGLFTAVDPHEAKGREVSARELLDRGAQRIGTSASLDEEQKAEIESTLGRIYYQLGLLDQADKLQEDAIKTLAARGDRQLLYARTESDKADTEAERGDLKAAATLAADARIRIDAMTDATASDRARALHAQARVAIDQRDFAAAKRFSDAELAVVRSAPVEPVVLYEALQTAGGASWGLETWKEAEGLYREALAVAEQQPHPDELSIATAQTNLAMSLQSQSRFSEAVSLQQQALAVEEKALGPNHPMTMALRRDMALAQQRIGHYGQARALFEQVLAAQRAKLGNDHPAIAGTEINLGALLIESGDADAAEKMLTESVAIFEKKYGRDFDGTRIALGNLAAAHTAQRKFDQAAAELAEVSAQETKRGQIDKDRVVTIGRLGEVARLRGDTQAAIELQRRAVGGAHEKYGENDRYTARAHNLLALALRDSGDDAGAVKEFRAALASYAAYIPQAAHPLAAATRYELGLILLKRDETRPEGVRLLIEAAALCEEFLGSDDPCTKQAREAVLNSRAAAKTEGSALTSRG